MNKEEEKQQKYRTLRKIKGALKNYTWYFLDKASDTFHFFFGKFSKEKNEEILEYRKKIKIYDIFTFFNELELLEIRLNILDSYVDYFVIVEATETFSGKTKPLYYEQNKNLFKKWEHKIIHYVVTDTPQSFTDKNCDQELLTQAINNTLVPKDQFHWVKEFYQKGSLKNALVGLNDDDICFVSDLDEIWNPQTVIDYTKNNIFKLRQLAYAYYLNNRSNERWAGTLMTKYKNIKTNCLNDLRTPSKNKYTYIKNGGWHFTNMGGADRIRTKLESYGHQEFNNSKTKHAIEKKIKENKDFIGRYFKFWVDESDLPQYLIENKEKYKHFFK